MRTDPYLRSSHWREPVRLALLLTVLILVSALLVQAQEEKPTEYQVKAAYLYNFAKFVEWPATAAGSKDDSFYICVLGTDPFRNTLDITVSGEKVNSHTVTVRRIIRPEDSASCRILFISQSEQDRLVRILASVSGLPVLTVSDIPKFVRHGGMIQFGVEENKVRFAVNLAVAERAGLTLSSELLKVATNVVRTRRAGD